MATRKIGDYVQTRILHANPADQEEEKRVLQKIAQDTIGDPYFEEDPTVAEWFRDLVPTAAGVGEYFQNLFPSASWLRRYNLHWLLGDAIAGVTVGLVVVPQAMAYASLARLTPAYGLYTTFTGACLYFIFGTSKDIVIGATAVGSLLIGQVVATVEEERPGVYEPQEIAHAMCFLCGLILLFLGFCRLGWLIEFIPYPPINAFVTAASITIISTQLPTCLGIQGINTREAPYKVYINTLKGLPNAQLDAAIGISSIVLLFAIQSFCSKMEVRQPAKKRMWGILSSLRLTFTVLLYTFVSWLVHRTVAEGNEQFRIVGHIEKGFSHAGVPRMGFELFRLVAGELPAIVIILIVEHIAIAKNFARLYGYTVIPSQEILAQGFANLLSPFVGGYVCTGSFGASAVLTKAGVKTPLAGTFSALVLLLALYALTAVFHYIPNAALAGLIIHATWNLVTPPYKLYKFWQYSPFELGIWVISVILAIFIDLETSIYVGIVLSFALLLIRMARTPAQSLGCARVTRIPHLQNADSNHPCTNVSGASTPSTLSSPSTDDTPGTSGLRDIYLPSTGKSAHNPRLKITPAHPGVFIYRFAEGYNYINQAHHIDYLLTHIYAHTRRTIADDGVPLKDRLWSDAPPPSSPPSSSSSSSCCNEEDDDGNGGDLATLKALVIDFSTVNIIDVTSVQGLVDLRNTLDKYASPNPVIWHFVGVHNRWTRRALATAGFGRPHPSARNTPAFEKWSPSYTVSSSLHPEISGVEEKAGGKLCDEEAGNVVVNEKSTWDAVHGVDRPFFHVDLGEAVNAAVRDARIGEELRRRSVVHSEGEV
ncbi:sulfate permease-like protein [Bimuria novae-zelandiae CBS 107.79]|uniref:Sulfate permease-like protein n=1 Tax=Bimuria novae-zelandiae CBS 107.79 TaxID=1447943 RepID=A0A6A5UNB8_9PLEO|nr:sulfate permease-like protein [Bimuria novae-zelandiae CBS 107.79]